MTNRKQKILLILCWAAYAFAYLGRYSYNANIVPMEQFFNSEGQMGIATTFFFVAYGVGQIINGLLCKRYNMRIMIPLALIVSSVLNCSVFLGLPFTYIKYAWLLNGLAQSILWPSIVYVTARNLRTNYVKASILVLGTTVSTGTFLSYGLSALFSLFNGWRYSFLVATVVMSTIAVIWFLIHNKITDYSQGKVDNKQEVKENTSGQMLGQQSKKNSLFTFILFFGVFAVFTNLIKDGLGTWMPKVMNNEFGLPTWVSILSTLLLPMVGMFGTFFATHLRKKFKNFAIVLGILFFCATIGMGVAIILYSPQLWYLVLIVLAFVTLFMNGTNATLTSIIPITYRDRFNSGLTAGLINGCCYVGSALSQFALETIALSTGWMIVFYILLGLCLVPLLMAIFNFIYRRIRHIQD